jgi:hypothetical protein
MRAIVIGAGPSGLAAAACLKKAGFTPEILDAGKKIGDSWRRHYDRLHLHTARGRSGLPGLSMPRGPRYPARDEVIDYLQAYAETFDLRPKFGCAVKSVRPSNSGWRVTHAKGASEAPIVVFATGLNGAPYVPDFEGLGDFGGSWVHSSAYKNADPYKGKRVLVVGFGNTAGDVALDLAEAGVAVDMAVRGPVNLLPKELFGIPVTSLGILRKILPYKLVDALTAPILWLKLGRNEDYGLRSKGKGPNAQVIEDGRIPMIDVGALAEIKKGRIGIKPGPESFSKGTCHFVGGSSAPYDAVIFATGYRVDLRPILGPMPDVLDETGKPIVSGGRTAAHGLYFCSYYVSPDGQLRQSGLDAEAIAADAVVAARGRQLA